MRYLTSTTHGEASVFDTDKSVLIMANVRYFKEYVGTDSYNLYKSNYYNEFYLVHPKLDVDQCIVLNPMDAFKLYFKKLQGVLNIKEAEKLFGIKINGDI